MGELFFESVVASALLVVLTCGLYYEIMRIVWRWIANADKRSRHLMYMVIIAIFIGHTVNVWIYALAIWYLADIGFGTVVGLGEAPQLIDFVYFSASTYSSLGYGDIYPTDALRMIAGVEVINGLVLIGWSVTFTYFMMQELWKLHAL